MKWTMVLLALAASTGDTARVKNEGKEADVEQAIASDELTKEMSNAGASSWHMSVVPMDVEEACTYTDLLKAKASERGSVVDVAFCNGRQAVLSSFDYSQFAGIQWTDPLLAGLELLPEDTDVIQKYTGSYAFAGNVAKSVLNGLLPVLPDPDAAGDAWKSTSLPALTQEVLAFDVQLARALNKLPQGDLIEFQAAGKQFEARVISSEASEEARSIGMTHLLEFTLGVAGKQWLRLDTANNLLYMQGREGIQYTKKAWWRGAWEVQASIDFLQKKPSGLARPRIARPQFQSTSLSRGHACNFMSNRNEPDHCRYNTGASHNGASGCVTDKVFFPVLYELKTVHAKDVRTWNAEEEEFILVPEVSFDVVSVEKIPNDKLFGMSPEELAQWLNTEKYVGADVFPELADVVKAESISGAVFVAGIDRDAGPKYVHNLLDLARSRKQLPKLSTYDRNVTYGHQLSNAMEYDRFKLECASIGVESSTTVINKVPYYYHVVMQDSATQGDAPAPATTSSSTKVKDKRKREPPRSTGRPAARGIKKRSKTGRFGK